MRINVRSCSGSRLALVVLGVLVSALLPASASAATRTWVSGVGDDANPCSRTAPCKTLASAISKTDAGGEIDLLDPAGVGSVTITKAITINGNGFQAGVLVAGTNGIVINAAATDDVILHGLNIEGLGSGLNGVLVLSAHNVQITETKIHGFVTAGVSVAGSAVDTNVLLTHDSISGTATGLNVSPVAPHTSSFFVSASSLTGDATAVRVDTGGTVWLQGTTIFGNTTGLSLLGTGVANAYADTSIIGNATNGVPTAMLRSSGAGSRRPCRPRRRLPAGGDHAARDRRVRCALDDAPRPCRAARIRCDSQRDRDDDGAPRNDGRREAQLGRTPGPQPGHLEARQGADRNLSRHDRRN